MFFSFSFFFFQAEDGIRDAQESRGLGDVYKRQMLSRLSATRTLPARMVTIGHRSHKTSSCRDIVSALDLHIIGQNEAKRALAVALRDRWRRKQISDESMRADVFPNNILMSGPTGSGKTECARRLSKIVGAPFVRCEATRFTEVGIVGATPDLMVKDLADEAIAMEQEHALAGGEKKVAGVV
eukprot:TRINITY_DN22205_c0_g2_i1.p1 TRINITY_DN22205_c0_g2~~TRINITY_DN22205_c0_g2_i1.p1  ORF type:complete len:183 (+),score=47.64 TRINITY_DN22205_c0_g2_i1:116-664(+)